MKKFIDIKHLVDNIEMKKRDVMPWLDRLTFKNILFFWVLIIMLIGFTYFFLAGSKGYLYSTMDKVPVQRLSDTIYFSFVAATTTGFGDIVPVGLFKFLSIAEVIFSIILLALVTSKIVSIKQDMILNEVYELSFYEKINRLRSSLLLFRQNLSRMATKLEDGTLKRREVAELYMYISSFEDTLNEIQILLGKKDMHFLKRSLDPVNTELMLNSVLSSFDRLNEFIADLNKAQRVEWRRETAITLLSKCLESTEEIFRMIVVSKKLPEKLVNSLNSRKGEILAATKKFMENVPENPAPAEPKATSP